MSSETPPLSPAPAQHKPRLSKLSVFTVLLGLVWIPWPLTIICGHIARGRIRRSAGALTGKGVALLGLLLGYLGMFAAIAAMIFGGIYLWRTTGAIRTDLAAGRDPAAVIMERLGGPVATGILKAEAFLPANVRQQIDTALDESAAERLEFLGRAMLEHARANNGRLPDTIGQALKHMTLPGANGADTATAIPDALAGNTTLFAFLARGLVIVPGLTNTLHPDTVIAHSARARADGSVTVCLLSGATANLDSSDPRISTLKLTNP